MLCKSCRQVQENPCVIRSRQCFCRESHWWFRRLFHSMQDQVKALNEAGVPAAFINSSLSEKDYNETIRRARQGRLQNYLYSAGAARHRGVSRSCKKRTYFNGDSGRSTLYLTVGGRISASVT